MRREMKRVAGSRHQMSRAEGEGAGASALSQNLSVVLGYSVRDAFAGMGWI